MFLFNLRNDKRGMTLIEMVIALVIFSILMTSTLGMITSSMNIFASTSLASVDRMVGNSIFSTLESALKYSTHLTISPTEKPENTSQSFYVEVSEEDRETTNSGRLFYRSAGEEYLNLYSDEFYNNRTIQYSVKGVGSDQKHVEIIVNVFREGELVYTKSSVVKCLNLALIRTGSNANALVDSSEDDSVNQYLYFSVDEMLIAGGSSAWSVEYKLNDYISRYNAIHAEYYGKLAKTYAELNAIAEQGKKTTMKDVAACKTKAEINAVYANIERAVLGDGTNSTSWEGDDPSAYLNLRKHYQDEIRDLLKFTPTKGITKRTDVNAYYGVVATKEELYAGFLLSYYDTNGDGKIVKSEYPQFDDPDSFFEGTVFTQYADPDENGMVILAHFRENSNENYDGLASFLTNQHVWVKEASVYIPEGDPEFQRITTYNYSRASLPCYSGSTSYLTKISRSDSTLTSLSTNKGIFGGKSDFEKWSYYSVARKLDSSNCSITVNNTQIDFTATGLTATMTTEYCLNPKIDLVEGWYYIEGLNNYNYCFYLQAFTGTATDANGNSVNLNPEKIVVRGSENGSTRQNDIYLYANNTMVGTMDGTGSYKAGHIFYYQQRFIYGENVHREELPGYFTFTQHEYKDWIMYSVDWNSWFSSEQQGLINSVISGITNWITDTGREESITQITGDNAYDVLGYKGVYTADTMDAGARSYNLAWMVYSPRRGTWYYIPGSSNRIQNSISTNISWTSFKDEPTILDVEAWPQSSSMINDIEQRRLSKAGAFGLIDTTQDTVWVPLPAGEKLEQAPNQD